MHVGEAFGSLSSTGHEPAAFIAESILSCGGQIEPPAGYLEEAYRIARSRGAICIADEVQIGFGRVGSHMWGFQTGNVVPDIVTLPSPSETGTPSERWSPHPKSLSFRERHGVLQHLRAISPAAIGLAVLDIIEGAPSGARGGGGGPEGQLALSQCAKVSEMSDAAIPWDRIRRRSKYPNAERLLHGTSPIGAQNSTC